MCQNHWCECSTAGAEQLVARESDRAAPARQGPHATRRHQPHRVVYPLFFSNVKILILIFNNLQNTPAVPC